ncbi:MAG: Asp-tRNA(Asn)/Glu-tRNA(Gln) amidotransferase subunit GatC [Desulfovibrio sp.]|nr:MAG: Asp-tRNA(Asn)/Glu-tRNA(Gln) amidotransferase subunit GatC [Desulfovibrio sp.]
MSDEKTTLGVEDAAAIAKLARLDLDQDVLARFAGQFNAILGYMDKLSELDTSGVEPMYSPSEHATVFREDRADNDRFSRDDVLSNAPESDGSFFIVPKIV